MQKPVEITSNGLTLRGMLHIPEGKLKNIPMVCIFHGFTGDKMEPHFIFVKLSRMLEAHGIASVRFDFGGSGESDGDFANMTISKELEDAKNILDYVKSLEFIDKSRIGVIGLSMGGAIASILAGERKDDISSLCLWAPAGVMRELIIQGQTPEQIKEMSETGCSDLGGLFLGKEFIDDIANIDIYGRSVNYDKNVLLIHGDADPTVPIVASYKYLEIYGQRAKIHVVKEADHTFNKKIWEDEVLKCTVNFFESELKV